MSALSSSLPSLPHVHPANSFADIERQVDRLLATGKAREALVASKGLLRRSPSHFSELLVVRCYQARLQELYRRGLVQEAQQILVHLSTRFPQHVHMTGFSRCEMPVEPAAAASKLDAFLREAGQAGCGVERRHELAREVGQILADPRDLLEHPALPPSDPWKKDAEAVWRAFEAVATRPVAPEDLAGLDLISRRSPLASWKLLTRALLAYYEGRDEEMERNLKALPPDGVLARLQPVLRRLAVRIGDQGTPAPVALEEGRLATLSGGAWGLERALAQAEGLLRKGAVAEGFAAAREHLRLLLHYRPERACGLLVALSRAALDEGNCYIEDVTRELVLPMRGFKGGNGMPEALRITALALEHTDPREAVCQWEYYLGSRAARGPHVCPSTEVRLVRTRMATLLAAAEKDPLDGPRWGRDSPPHQDYAKQLRLALEAEPHPEAFRALHNELSRTDPSGARQVAEQWHAAFPNDLEPLLLLVRWAEESRALDKALRYLEQAGRIQPFHAGVRSARLRLMFQRALAHLREEQPRKGARDAEDLLAGADGRDQALGWAVRLAWAIRLGGKEGIRASHEALRACHSEPLFGAWVGISVTQMAGVAGGEAVRAAPSLSSAGGLEAMLDALDLLSRVHGLLFFPEGGLEQAERVAQETPALPETTLVRLCRLPDREIWPRMLYLASGRGLLGGGSYRHLFMYYRGLALQKCIPPETPRACVCLRAAAEMARRGRDTEILGLAQDALRGSMALSGRAVPEASADAADRDVQHAIAREKRQAEAEATGVARLPSFAPSGADRKRGKRRKSWLSELLFPE